MQRWALGTIIWAIVVCAAFNNNIFSTAASVDENTHIDKLNLIFGEEKNRVSFENDTRVKDENGLVSNEEGVGIEAGANENGGINSEAIRKQLRKNKITDILVACFFFVAAIWLILATGYSIILLILLRLQARGELDIYDENLGSFVLFNGKLTLHFGCILRRYAIQLEEVSFSLAYGIIDFANIWWKCYLTCEYFISSAGLSKTIAKKSRRQWESKWWTRAHSNHDTGRKTKSRGRASWGFGKNARRRMWNCIGPKKENSRSLSHRCFEETSLFIMSRYIHGVFRRRTRLFDLSDWIRAHRFGVPFEKLSSHVSRRMFILVAWKEKQYSKWRRSTLFEM